jgi:hypothetical protein
VLAGGRAGKDATMAAMSTSYIGSDALTAAVSPLPVPGFDVLNPTSYAQTPSTPAPATPPSTGSSATSAAATGQNPYQQALSTLETWQNQVLQQSLGGNTADATNALYASAGLNADQFASLATELQNLGSTIDTTA